MNRDLYEDNPNLYFLMPALILSMMLWASYHLDLPFWSVLFWISLGAVSSFGLGSLYLKRHRRDVTENDRIARKQVQDLIDEAESSWDEHLHRTKTSREENERRKASGRSYFAADGTLMTADGKRSIFDDVDQ